MNRITIEKIVSEKAFELLRDEWKQLFAEATCSPFLSWEWLSVWYKWFGVDRSPFILKVTRENKLIGLLPLCLREEKAFGIKLKRLSFIGEATGGADYLDAIVRTEDKAEVLSAVFDYLKKENCFDLICLGNMESISTTLDLLQNLNHQKPKQQFRYIRQTTEVCPKIDLADGWEKILKHGKRASNFKRRLKQLEKMPDFEFRSITSPLEISQAFERFYQLHEIRWRRDGGSELSGHLRLVSFQRELVLTLAQSGLVRFEELWVKGECRASIYGLDDGQTFYYYNSGYDLEWSKFSVGLVLIGLSVKSAIERGRNIYDFLRGEETYKFDWANHQTELVTVSLNRRTFPAFAQQAKNHVWINLRDFSKNVLPSNLAEKLKRQRRQWKRDHALSDLQVEAPQEVL